MNKNQEKYERRLEEVIIESDGVINTSRLGEWENSYCDETLLHTWLVKSANILKLAFGENSIHYSALKKLIDDEVVTKEDMNCVKGVLTGALDDYHNGYYISQEFLIAGEVFDSVLEEAKSLLNNGHKDASAVLGRVVVEDHLKRLARHEGIVDNSKASKINEDLWKANVYTKPQWRLIQAWLDTGNEAAHGNFSKYNSSDVKAMLAGVEQLLANII